MENGSAVRRQRAWACMFLLSMAGFAMAQARDVKAPELSVRVTAIAAREFTGLEKTLIKVFEKAVREKGFKASDRPDVEVFTSCPAFRRGQ